MLCNGRRAKSMQGEAEADGKSCYPHQTAHTLWGVCAVFYIDQDLNLRRSGCFSSESRNTVFLGKILSRLFEVSRRDK